MESSEAPDPQETLVLILEEQRKTNHLLALLIEVMAEAEEEADEDAEPTTYLDGSPAR